MKERVQELCKKNSISVSELEKTLGFGNGYISKLGQSTPNTSKIKLIADYFNVSIDYIITGEEKHPIPVPKMTDEYYKLISIYSSLSETDRNYIMSLAERLNQK
jgi:transcriptional regulator with XRE-family HTH domain